MVLAMPLVCIVLYQAPTTPLTGNVVGPNGEPVAGAEVLLGGLPVSDQTVVARGRSDAQGRFTIERPAALAGENLGRGSEGLDAAGHAGVYGGVQEGLADLLDAAAIGEGSGDVHLELIGLGQGGQCGQGNQAARLAVQARPCPGLAEAVPRHHILERPVEVRGLAIALFGAAGSEHLPPYLHPRGECRIFCLAHTHPPSLV